MAGDEVGDGVHGEGRAHGPGSLGGTRQPRKTMVGGDLPLGNGQERLPHLDLEGGALQQEGQGLMGSSEHPGGHLQGAGLACQGVLQQDRSGPAGPKLGQGPSPVIRLEKTERA